MPAKMPKITPSPDWKRVLSTGMEFTEMRRSQARSLVSDLVAQGHLALRRLVQQIVELVADGGELEPRQAPEKRLMIDRHRRHGVPPSQDPPSNRSYSASGRSSAAGVGAARIAGRAAPATPWKWAGSMTR